MLIFQNWHTKKVCRAQIAPLAGLFGRGSGVIWPIYYFEVGNLCYGRVSFRDNNDDCSARILFIGATWRNKYDHWMSEQKLV